jgi:hypothetical protein
MKTYRVVAERVVLEVMEVEAKSEDDALARAGEADNPEWSTWQDESWEIKYAVEIE